MADWKTSTSFRDGQRVNILGEECVARESGTSGGRDTTPGIHTVSIAGPDGLRLELATTRLDVSGDGGSIQFWARGIGIDLVAELAILFGRGTEVVVDAGLYRIARSKLDSLHTTPTASGIDAHVTLREVVSPRAPAPAIDRAAFDHAWRTAEKQDAARGMSCWRCFAPVSSLTGLRRRVDGVWRDACPGCGHIEDAAVSQPCNHTVYDQPPPAVIGMPLTPGGANMLREQFGLPPPVSSDLYAARDRLIQHAFEYGGVPPTKPVDPLDVETDGVKLRDLLARAGYIQHELEGALACEERSRKNPERYNPLLTPAQRAAVSAHWSAELRAKVAASTAADKERERSRVVLPDDEMWMSNLADMEGR